MEGIRSDKEKEEKVGPGHVYTHALTAIKKVEEEIKDRRCRETNLEQKRGVRRTRPEKER